MTLDDYLQLMQETPKGYWIKPGTICVGVRDGHVVIEPISDEDARFKTPVSTNGTDERSADE